MVGKFDHDLSYTVASDTELNELAAGTVAGTAMPWSGKGASFRLPTGSTGVLWRSCRLHSDMAQPLALVVHEADRRRLFGRFSQVHSDLSPLSTWCHVLTPEYLESFDQVDRAPELGELEAAWSGLVVAEAMLLSSLPLTRLRSASCFATQTYAIARTRALWPRTAIDDICNRLHAARSLVRGDNSRLSRLRLDFQPVWSVLAAATGGRSSSATPLQPIVEALQLLMEARSKKDEREAARIAVPLEPYISLASSLRDLQNLQPEERLQLYDHLVDELHNKHDQVGSTTNTALAFLAGYIATVAAGGATSLGLANASSADFPQVAAWAYALGGVGERVTWTASFDGLGRLVARELTRTFRLDERPDCDFALDEAATLVDPELSDPLVHLRIKQGRNILVAIYPGVNVTIPTTENPPADRTLAHNVKVERQQPLSSDKDAGDAALALIADAVWERLQPRLDERLSFSKSAQSSKSYSTGKSRKSGKSSGQDSTLPLSKPPRWR